ncbi:MAG: hybrid sensor histidine kinase/response regulator [Methylobacter sp.]
MKQETENAIEATELRQKAEQQLAAKPEIVPATSGDEKKLVHELQVHQIELEIQNQALLNTQRELEISRTRYFELYDLAPVGYLTMSEQGLIQEANLTACNLLGLPRSRLIKQSLSSFILPDDQDNYYLYRKQLIASGEPQVAELRLVKQDGVKIWVRLEANQAKEPEGLAGFRVAISDISKNKQTEQALQDASTRRKLSEEKIAEQNQNLYESDQRKDLFLAMLAHELRNPLAPIRNAAEILKRTDLEPDRIAWCSQIIDRQTKHMVGIVDDLLDISRINRGLIELNKESLEIQGIVLTAIESCRPLIDAKRQAFCLELPPEPLWVEGDRIRLTQAVANLINNAAKYTQEGGRIKLSVELSEEMVCIRVQDSGCGIDPADLPHLFDLFYQTDRNLDRSQGGLGIGLSLVQNMVAKHGGTVQAFSAGRGQGSEFVIRLHRHDLPNPEPTGIAALTALAQKKLRILLVDDNRDAAESLALLLKIEGHQVRTAYDGPAALELARAEWPEVILLDIGLPGMNGYLVAQELRRHRELERTLLIALTGYGQSEDREKSCAAGFDAHLVKPLDLEMLRKLLAEHAG